MSTAFAEASIDDRTIVLQLISDLLPPLRIGISLAIDMLQSTLVLEVLHQGIDSVVDLSTATTILRTPEAHTDGVAHVTQESSDVVRFVFGAGFVGLTIDTTARDRSRHFRPVVSHFSVEVDAQPVAIPVVSRTSLRAIRPLMPAHSGRDSGGDASRYGGV